MVQLSFPILHFLQLILLLRVKLVEFAQLIDILSSFVQSPHVGEEALLQRKTLFPNHLQVLRLYFEVEVSQLGLQFPQLLLTRSEFLFELGEFLVVVELPKMVWDCESRVEEICLLLQVLELADLFEQIGLFLSQLLQLGFQSLILVLDFIDALLFLIEHSEEVFLQVLLLAEGPRDQRLLLEVLLVGTQEVVLLHSPFRFLSLGLPFQFTSAADNECSCSSD